MFLEWIQDSYVDLYPRVWDETAALSTLLSWFLLPQLLFKIYCLDAPVDNPAYNWDYIKRNVIESPSANKLD